MHWIDEAVNNLISKNPNKQSFTCAAGISPSGPIHIGNFREFLTAYLIHSGLKMAGKESRFLLSFDDFDRLRKVPFYVKQAVGDSYDKYIGCPYCGIPDPFGCHKSYGEHFEEMFTNAVKNFGIQCDYISQYKKYQNGDYSSQIIKALQNRKTIYDILYEYKSQEATEEGRDAYVPIQVYCSNCGHDSTTVTNVSEDCTTVSYTCKCGHTDTVNINDYHNIKLVWKADWPMRWAYEQVTFEPGGKDHATEGSSYTVGKVIVDKVFNFKAPDFIMYEFIGIKGGAGKMSSSSGSVITPNELLKICPPEMILWMYIKTPSRQSITFCLDEDILRQYNEFDRSMQAYESENCPQNIKDIIKYVKFSFPNAKACKVSAQLLFSLGSIVNFEPNMTYELYKKVDPSIDKQQLLERLKLISYWATNYSPESITKLLNNKNTDYFNTLTNKEQEDIKSLYNTLAGQNFELNELQQMLYDIPKDENLTDKENKTLQTKFFQNVYMLLTGKSSGPRLYLFLGALNKEMYLNLLNF